jgi:hypothetical protein
VSRAAGDAVEGENPAAVVKRTSSPSRITITRSFDWYLNTVSERVTNVLPYDPYLFDQFGLLDDGIFNWQIAPIGKRCRPESRWNDRNFVHFQYQSSLEGPVSHVRYQRTASIHTLSVHQTSALFLPLPLKAPAKVAAVGSSWDSAPHSQRLPQGWSSIGCPFL